jgi:DNA repair exonuclease SbcCD nuclease subunit
MQAIILGDPHLGAGLSIGKIGIGSNLNSRVSDQLNLLEWVLQQSIHDDIDHIIITGDIFEDPKPPPSIIAFFMAWLKKCQAYKVHVHLIVGNHDVLRSGFSYSSPLDIIAEAELDNVSIYKDINTVFIGATAFTFMPFRDRKSLGTASNSEALSILKDSLIYELAGIPATYKKVVVGHLAIEGSIPVGDEIDDLSNELFCPLEMFEGYDYIWMGHVHKPQIMKKSNPYVAHIGSMDTSNFGETDHKKIVIVVDCISSQDHFTTKTLPTRSLKKINIVIPKDTEDTTKYVVDYIDKNYDKLDSAIVKLEISLSDPELIHVNKSIIEKHLLEKGSFNVSGISESKKLNIIKKDAENSIHTKMDVPVAIKTYASAHVEEKNKDKFIELAMDIYNTYKAEGKE